MKRTERKEHNKICKRKGCGEDEDRGVHDLAVLSELQQLQNPIKKEQLD